MRVGNFSLLIPEGRERDSGHVEMGHNTQYTLRLGNHSPVDCDAEVSIDGKSIGGFRVRAGATGTLERPAHDTGRFTFFEANSQQAQDAGAQRVGTDQRGLVQVVFRPERRRVRETKTSGGFLSAFPTASYSTGGTCRSAAGVTGLTGRSSQHFYEVPSLDYEPNAEVTISLRIVCAAGVRELTPASNSVPAPV